MIRSEIKKIKMKSVLFHSSSIFLTIIYLLLINVISANASTYKSPTGSSYSYNLTILPGSHTFIVDGILTDRKTEWYVNSIYKETDTSSLLNGYWDPDYSYDFSGSGTTIIKAIVYNFSWTVLETHIWNCTIDTTGPPAPTNLKIRSSDDSGYSNSDGITKIKRPYFEWTAPTDTSGIIQYHWLIQTSGGSSIQENYTTNTNVQPSSDLSDGNYKFLVQAKDGAGNWGSWSSSYSFTIDSTAPAAPSLISPANNSRITISTPSFDWSDITDSGSGIYQYTLLVETDTLGIDKINVNTSSSNYNTLSGQSLPAGGNGYVWRVQVTDKAGNTSSWSNNNLIYIDDPFVVNNVTVSLNKSSATTDETYQRSGTISGTGNGTVTYRWENLPPNSSTWEQSLISKSVNMVNGSATITAEEYNVPSPSGTHKFRVTVTSPNSKTSNEVSLQVTINKPDLQVSALNVNPSTIQAGSQPTVTATVKNYGAGGAFGTYVGFYLSTNSTWDGNDTFLGHQETNALSPGASQNYNINITIPSSTPAGSYYLIAVADYKNEDNRETDENNNTRSVPVSIIVFQVNSVTANLNKSSATTGETYQRSGTISGTGNGTVTYRWESLAPNSSTWEQSLSKSTTMINGSATITVEEYNVPSPAGTHKFRVVITSPNSKTSDEASLSNTLSFAIIVTVDGLDFTNFAIPVGFVPPQTEAYMADAIKTLNIPVAQSDVLPFLWNRDARTTDQHISSLRTFLRNAFNKAKNENKKFIIISHSWGTFLSYMALSFESTVQNPIRSDLFITLSSPLGTYFAHQPPPYLAEIPTNGYVNGWLSALNYSSCTNCYPLVNRWVNYWAWGDLISGPVDAYDIQSINIQVDTEDYNNNADYRNFSTTNAWHMYTSLQSGGTIDNQPIKDKVAQEINHSIESGTKDNMEVELYRVSDTTGAGGTSNPGTPKTSFRIDETVRVTLRARNNGPSNVNATWVLNLGLGSNHGNVPYDSHVTEPNSHNGSIPNDGQWYYHSFNWTIKVGTTPGSYDLLGAIRDGNNWNTVLDDTQSGANTSTLGPNAWKSAGFSVTVAPSMEVTLYRVSDTTGTSHTSNPGTAKTSFTIGQTVRVTLQARNNGPSSVNANWVLNLNPSNNRAMSPAAYNSDPNSLNANDKTIPNDGQWYYYSFDWTIGSGAALGSYDFIGAIRDANNWYNVLDDTEDGINTITVGDNAWKSAGFSVTSAASIEVNLYRVSDTTGTPHTSSPGTVKNSFTIGQTVRVTLQARNNGPSSVNANWVLNLNPSNNRSMNPAAYNSDPNSPNTNDKSIPNDGQWVYYSFEWTIGSGVALGSYDLIGAIRAANDWYSVLDDTQDGINTTSVGDNAWKSAGFKIASGTSLVPTFLEALVELANMTLKLEGKDLQSFYNQHTKYLGYIKGSILGNGVAIYIDLADYYSAMHPDKAITLEGASGDKWITMWIDVFVGLGKGLLPGGIGIIPMPFTDDIQDPLRLWKQSGINSSIPFLQTSGIYNTNEGFDWGQAQFAPAIEFSASLFTLGWNVLRFEIKKPSLDALFSSTLLPTGLIDLSAMLNLGNYLSDELIQFDGWKALPKLAIIRDFTVSDSNLNGAVYGGMIDHIRGGYDLDGDGIPDNVFPIMPDFFGIPFVGVDLEVTFHNTGKEFTNYFIQVKDVPDGVLVGAVDKDNWTPIIDRKIDFKNVSPTGWDSLQTTKWAVAFSKNGPETANVTFELYKDNIWPIPNELLDSVSVTLRKYVPNSNIRPTLNITEPSQNLVLPIGTKIPIGWSASDPDNDAIIALAWDPDLNNIPWEGTSNHTWITTYIHENSNNGSGVYLWDTSNMPEGQYSIWGMVYDGVNGPVYSRASSTITLTSVVQTSYTIFGKVAVGELGLSGVTMNGLPGNPTPITDLYGNYLATVPSGWSGEVKPLKGGYSFTPASKNYPNVISNQIQNYIGDSDIPPNCITPPTSTVSAPSSAQSGVDYTVSWTSSSNATRYLIQESISSNFTNPADSYVTAPTTSKTFNHAENTNTTYYYRVIANNEPCSLNSGPSNLGQTTVNSVLSDTTPPSLSITTHTNGQQVTQADITITGTASDAGKGDNGISQVIVNGVRADNDTATGSGTANWSKSVPLIPGTNPFTIIAFDGNTNQTSLNINIVYTPKVNGQCGTSNGGIFNTKPTDNLCASGTASNVTGSGPWTWSCTSTTGGTTDNCSANIQTYTISGKVTSEGKGLGGVVLSGFSGSVTTNADGIYSTTVNYGWIGTISPVKSGYLFTPAVKNYSSVSSNQTQDYSGTLEQTPLQDPSVVSTIPLPCAAERMALQGDFLYVACSANPGYMAIIDVKDPQNPVKRGEISFTGHSLDIAVKSNLVFVASHFAGVQIIDVSDPDHPALVGTMSGSGYYYSVAVRDNYAYTTYCHNAFRIFDFSNPSSPSVVSTTGMPYCGHASALAGDIAYISISDNPIQIFNIANPQNPVNIGQYGPINYVYDMRIEDGRLYVADRGFKLLDISNSSAPALLGSLSDSNNFLGVAKNGNYVYLNSGNGSFNIVDATNPSSLNIVYTLPVSENALKDVEFKSGYAFLAAGADGVKVVNLGKYSSPNPTTRYTVTPSVGTGAGHGTITPSTAQQVDHGATTAFTVTPDANYTATVTGTCGGTLTGTTFTTNAVTQDCTVIANFALVKRTVTPSVGTGVGHGTITPSTAQQVDHGATTAFTITPDANYTATVGGTCGGRPSSGTSEFTYTTNAITSPCTVEVTFSVNNTGGLAYAIQEIPLLPGYSNIMPMDINNSGQVTGRAWGSGYKGFYWEKGFSAPQLLNFSEANSINDSSNIVGYGNGSSWTYSYSYDAHSQTYKQLPVSGYNPLQINSVGQIIGHVSPGTAYRLETNDQTTNLGSLPNGYRYCYGHGLNDSGVAVGACQPGGNWNSYGYFSNGTDPMVQLNPLDGYAYSWAQAINNAGVVIGWSGQDNVSTHATLWKTSGLNVTDKIDLGLLTGYANTNPRDLRSRQ